MLAGPVFEFELLTTARRGRYFVMRAAYASLLLYGFYMTHLGWVESYGSSLTPRQLRQYAIATFSLIAGMQVLLVLALTPALAAGLIASERQSKTLHYVMASSLTGFEVVFGKLLARLLHVGVLLAVGLPVLSMLVLLGGVDPWLVLVACGAAASCAFFIASFSVLVSLHAKRVREALFVCYSIELLWLVGPEIIRLYASYIPFVGSWIYDLNGWLLQASPFAVARTALFGFVAGGFDLATYLENMILIQVVAGSVLVIFAALRLRPVYRRQESGQRPDRAVLRIARRSRQLAGRVLPEMGDDPMGWKERYAGRPSILSRVVGVLMAAVFLFVVGVGLWNYAPDAYRESFWSAGGPFNWQGWWARTRLFWFLQMTIAWLFVIALLAVTATAAGAITAEHEGDTWISLTTTDLTPREILWAKFQAALRTARSMVIALGVLLLVGLGCGSIHPIGAPAVTLSYGVYLAFAASFGLWVSLQFRSTWRAQFIAVISLLLINLISQTIVGLFRPYSEMVWPGFMPVHVATSVFGPGFPSRFLEGLRAYQTRRNSGLWDLSPWEPFTASMLDLAALIGYSLGAYGFFKLALRRFDQVAGRAARKAPSKVRAVASRAADPVPAGA